LDKNKIPYYFFNVFYDYNNLNIEPESKIDKYGRIENQICLNSLWKQLPDEFKQQSMYRYVELKGGQFLERNHPTEQSHEIISKYLIENINAFKNDYELASWVAPNDSIVEIEFANRIFSHMEQLEHTLQTEFGNFLLSTNEIVQNIAFTIEGEKGKLRPDFWLPERNLVVEAKVSTTRNYVRQAIGQVLDYQNLAKQNGLNPNAAILLPGLPSPDLVLLLAELGIKLIIKNSDNDFKFL
jgi:hypothetical protein